MSAPLAVSPGYRRQGSQGAVLPSREGPLVRRPRRSGGAIPVRGPAAVAAGLCADGKGAAAIVG
jgi:hypothetical protein